MCSSIIIGCLNCIDSDICGKCIPGYRLSGQQCIKCKNGCKRCDENENCYSCENKYFLSATYDC